MSRVNESRNQARWLIPAALVAAGISSVISYYAGRTSHPAPQAMNPMAQSVAQSSPGTRSEKQPEIVVDVSRLREEVRAVLKEELRAAQMAQPTHKGEGEVDEAEESDKTRAKGKEADKASLAAKEQSLKLVENARGRRRWSEQDAIELRAMIPKMTDEQRHEVLRLLLPAINRGELAMDFRGPF